MLGPPQRDLLTAVLGQDGSRPLLFEIVDLAYWPRLIAALQRERSGSARPLSWRWGETVDGQILLHVSGMPAYAVLTALDEPTQPVHVYRERAPRVWVELGSPAPAIEPVAPAIGQYLLIRFSGALLTIHVPAWHEEIQEFTLPACADTANHAEGDASHGTLSVPLRLARSEADDRAELWVVRERPQEQLAELLSSVDEAVLAQLQIAELTDQGDPVLVLRATEANKQHAPFLVLSAETYRPYLKLPNVFLPTGSRLQPTLRRDAVRTALSADPGQIVWLRPGPQGSFRLERCALPAFQPLRERTAYVLDQVDQSLQPWNEDAGWELAKFDGRPEERQVSWREQFAGIGMATIDDVPSWWRRLRRWLQAAWHALVQNWQGPPTPSASTASLTEDPWARPIVANDPIADAVRQFLQPGSPNQAVMPPPVVAAHGVLEARFLGLAGALDAPERHELWPQLGERYQSEERWADAALCWLNACWQSDPLDPVALEGWWHSECAAAHWLQPADDFVHALMAPVQPADVRAVAAFTAWAAQQDAGSAVLLAHRAALGRYLAANEHLLPIRGSWLAWVSLARLAGGDPLVLARARDRLLERLHRHGLSPDLDLPAFVRFTGQVPGSRPASVRAWLVRQRTAMQTWLERLHAEQARRLARHPEEASRAQPRATAAYADLMVAWGLAALGAGGDAAALVQEAKWTLGGLDGVHRFLLAAFRVRIDRVQEGRLDSALDDRLQQELRRLPELERYKIDWFRHRSRILEPRCSVDPYRGEVQHQYFDDLHARLARLADIEERDELVRQIERLLNDVPGDSPTGTLPRILRAALEQAPRVGEAFALTLLERTHAILDRLADAPEEAPLLEQALVVAAHFGQTVQVQRLLERLHRLLERHDGRQAAPILAALAEHSFRNLRKLGLRAELDRLLHQATQRMLQGQPVPGLCSRLGTHAVKVLPTLLQMAGVWFYEGEDNQAIAVLDEARSLWFAQQLAPAEQTLLAKAYAAGLGQAPIGLALERIDELFERLTGIHDQLTTRSHFALAPLEVLEAVVRAVVDANFTLGASVRRWLDEDEYLVRRRLHRDVREMVK